MAPPMVGRRLILGDRRIEDESGAEWALGAACASECDRHVAARRVLLQAVQLSSCHAITSHCLAADEPLA